MGHKHYIRSAVCGEKLNSTGVSTKFYESEINDTISGFRENFASVGRAITDTVVAFSTIKEGNPLIFRKIFVTKNDKGARRIDFIVEYVVRIDREGIVYSSGAYVQCKHTIRGKIPQEYNIMPLSHFSNIVNFIFMVVRGHKKIVWKHQSIIVKEGYHYAEYTGSNSF